MQSWIMCFKQFYFRRLLSVNDAVPRQSLRANPICGTVPGMNLPVCRKSLEFYFDVLSGPMA
jgi:hypothetical protein